ncbi:MAG TPA: hypothetical protein VF511_00315 [Chthoniobacterales bacterium]|jgi:hypothetical protein
MKGFSLAFALVAGCSFAASANGGETVNCKSPDGKFALRHLYKDQQPDEGNFAVIELRTKRVAVQLEPDRPGNAYAKLVWSPDSQRFAYFSEEQRTGSTRVFFRNGPSFDEIKLPELPAVEPPAKNAADADTRRRIEPLRWLNSGELVLENELQNPSWGRAALEVTIAFDKERAGSVRKAEPQEKSIVDYFLLLPPTTFEMSVPQKLSSIRQHEVIDKKNGYIKCRGDGAEPDFEVALFRHRDGRPLLAICWGEHEGESSVRLEFYEMGSNGKMDKVARSVFPIGDSELPTRGTKRRIGNLNCLGRARPSWSGTGALGKPFTRSRGTAKRSGKKNSGTSLGRRFQQ